MNKPKVAIVSLTCCEGCQVAILDLGERFLELADKINLTDFDFLEEMPESNYFDITFIEGSPITEKNIQNLQRLREKSKYLIAIGACACLGGIQEIKNYQNKEEKMRYVYPPTLPMERGASILDKTEKGGRVENIANPDIKPLRDLVKIDLEIPGCPINKEEFLEICKKILAGIPIEHIKIAQRPVCYECQLRENGCLLQEDMLAGDKFNVGGPCLGPIMLGGCGAPCPSSNYPCDGCRGPLKNVNPNNLVELLKEKYNQEEIDMIMKRFGSLNDIYPHTKKPCLLERE